VDVDLHSVTDVDVTLSRFDETVSAEIYA
jgi:hypothetical protein